MERKIVKQYKDIELRSEEVQEVMDHIPSWIVRWGSTVLLSIVLILLIGSYWFKYPDIVEAEITVSTQNPPVYVLARVSGQLKELHVSNGTKVEKGALLGVIENATVTKDMLWLKGKMKTWEAQNYQLDEGRCLFNNNQYLQLGEMQPAYASFVSALNDYAEFVKQDYYNKKLRSGRKQLEERKEYYYLAKKQFGLANEEQVLTKRIYSRDSILYVRRVIMDNEYDLAQRSYLQNRQAYAGMRMSLSQISMQIDQDKEALLDLHHQALTEEQKYTINLKNATEQLQAEMASWEQRYLLVAPITGKLTFLSVWNNNQHVSVDESLFIIAPDEGAKARGRALLPVLGSGKVKAGQQVNIRLNNFPDQEFGYVKGKVLNVSPVPTTEGMYIVDIELPQGLRTNYGKDLPLSREMKGNAEIVTEDMRLIERLLAPIKKLKDNMEL